MKRTGVFSALLLFGTSMLFAPQHSSAQAGKAGMAFLKLGVSGRGISMGDAMSAIASGANATYYNPAGVLAPTIGSTQILLMHREWIQDVRTEFLGVGIQLDEVNALGFSINTTTVSDIEIRTRPGTLEDTFTSRDFALSATYARSVSDEVKIGISGKFLFERIFLDEASGFAVDLGGQFQTPVMGMTIGFALANLGSVSVLRSEKIRLPSLLRTGPALTFDLDEISSTLTAATDMVYVFPENKAYITMGGEFVFNKILAARVGFQPGTHARGFSGGIGVIYDMFSVDYAVVPLSSNLGSGHAFSLLVTF